MLTSGGRRALLHLAVVIGTLACAVSDQPPAPIHAVNVESLATLAAEQPDSTRDAIARALRLAAHTSSESERTAQLALARAHAQAYALAWSDSFFVRRVQWFEVAAPAARRASSDADSLWRAGRVIYGQEGVPAALRLWRESLRSADASGDSAARATALYVIGAGHYMVGELDSATIFLDRAHELARALGDYRVQGNVLGTRASISKDRGELADAARLYGEAGAIRERSGDARGQAADQNNIGLIARSLGDLNTAADAFERALVLNRTGGRDRAAAINVTNLGDIASMRGDYAQALAWYEEALRLNRTAGDVAESAFVLHHIGLLATRRGDYAAALTNLSAAIAIHVQTGARLDASAARADLAAVHAAMGDIDSAIATLSQAQRDAAAAGDSPAARGRLALARADLAAQFNAYAHAHAEYADAEKLLGEAGDDAGRAGAQQGRALLLLLRDDATGALELLERASRGYGAAGDVRAAAINELLLGDVRGRVGDTLPARQSLTAARATFRRLRDHGGEAATLLALGDLAWQRRTGLAAETLYRTGLDVLRDQPLPDTRWRLHAALARALRERGALGAATAELDSAVRVIESVAAGIPGEDRRSGFLSDKWQVYATLADNERARGRAAKAFEVSERMRARQLLATLERGRVATGTVAGSREQDLRRQIAELTHALESTAGQAIHRREPLLALHSVDAARQALAAAQREYSDLLAEIRRREPDYAAAVAASFVSWRDVASRLGRDEVMIQYLLGDSTSSVFVITPDTIAALDLGVGRRTIANLVDFARHAVDRPEASNVSPLWPGVLRRLHGYLIEPIERAGYLRGRRILVIVPHAELHFLPFAALLGPASATDFLVERFELTYVPSASVWVQLGRRTRPRSRNLLALAPHPTRLPASGEEVAAIRSALGRRNTTILHGPAAKEAVLRASTPRFGILHLATYGVLNKHNPLFSYVDLSPGDGLDGRLDVHEVFNLGLQGQLVVLSACQTGLASGATADVPAGDDWVGLVQAFLQAGAGGVVASLWSVEDRATAVLMKHFYEALAAGAAERSALAAAQRSLLRNPETAHPFFWAAFVMSGASRQ